MQSIEEHGKGWYTKSVAAGHAGFCTSHNLVEYITHVGNICLQTFQGCMCVQDTGGIWEQLAPNPLLLGMHVYACYITL
jgi:hypothetical protein